MSTVPIGEFSRLTHLSVKALRHYHEVGVLVPASVDRSSGYRRYDLVQLPDAHLARRLRELDLPLEEVRDVVRAGSTAERDRLLARHLERLEQQLERTRDVVSSLRRLLDDRPPESALEVRQVATDLVVVHRDHVAPEGIETWSVKTFAALSQRAGSDGGRSGALFGSAFFEDGSGEVTAFIVVDREGPDVVTLGGGTFAVAEHAGPYADLDLTYGALGSRIAADYPLGDGPIREHYLVGPTDVTDPSDYRTEVLWPLTV